MSTKTLGLVLAAAVLAITACTAPVSNTVPAPAATSAAAVETPDEDYSVPVVTWGPSTDAELKALATDLMGKFARTDVTERAWFNALQPHMSADYQESAQYIDPARIPVTKILSGPVLVREKENPLSVTAEFSTNNGPWVLSLHRVGQEAPWLITAIAPKGS